MERHSLPRRFAPGEDAAGRRSSQANLGTASGSCWGLVPTDSAPYLLSSPCVSPCETVVDRLLGPISQCGIVPVAVPMNDSNAAVRMVSSGICECGSPSSGYRPLAAVFAASWFILCMPDVSRTVQKLCKRNRAAADADALAERTAGSPGGESRRSAAWDNARFLLMVLVVCGHLGEPFLWQNAQPLASIGLWLNLWVMPSFVFVSGLWSPGHNPAARHYLSTFSIGLVYAVNQSLLIAVCILVPSLPITPAACDELLIGRSDCAEPVTGWSNLLSVNDLMSCWLKIIRSAHTRTPHGALVTRRCIESSMLPAGTVPTNVANVVLVLSDFVANTHPGLLDPAAAACHHVCLHPGFTQWLR
eukprot:SAG31_NODE_96_length_25743_cov_56.175948_24_plen_360_part_00